MKRLANYSQNFIRNPRLVSDLVSLTTINKNDTVYDIGAGSGVISSVLAEKCKAVIAVEFEPRAAAKLRENMEKYSNVSVYEGDFLTMDLPSGSYKIFANIPFHLSSLIVRKITEANNPPEATYLIVQKQFANKLLPNSDKFTGQLGMMVGPGFIVSIRRHLKRTDFWPHPNVDTSFIEIIRREEPLIDKNRMPVYRQFISDCFSDPKKFAKASRSSIGLLPQIRPSQMKLNQWVKLFEATKKR